MVEVSEEQEDGLLCLAQRATVLGISLQFCPGMLMRTPSGSSLIALSIYLLIVGKCSSLLSGV